MKNKRIPDLPSSQLPNAHKCPNGNKIRRYPSLLCSMCRGGGIDLVINEKAE